MIEVELPDGRILEFPEGTSQGDMRAAIQRLEQNDAMSGGLTELSDMTQNPQVINTDRPNRPFMHKIADNVVGMDDGVLSPGEKIAGLLNAGGEGMSFGLVGDELDARAKSAIRGTEYDEELSRIRSNEAQLREENPYMSATAEILGGMALPAGAASRGIGLLGRMALGGASAGTGAATYGFMEGEGGVGPRVDNAISTGVLGAGLGMAVPVLGAGIARGVDSVRGSRAIRREAANAPSNDELREAAGSLFRSMDDAVLPSGGLVGMAQDVSASGRAHGMDDMLTPNAARVAGNISDLANNAATRNGVPLSELNILRRQAAVPAGNMANRTESAIGSQMIESIDDFVDSVAPELGERGKEARRMWGVLRRSELMDQAFERAELAASGFENGLQTEFRRLLRNPKLMRGFSDAEKKAMNSVVNGGLLHGLLRQAGRFGFSMDGGSNALGGGIGLAVGSLGGPLGMGLTAALGAGARKGSEVLRTSKANRAAGLVRMPNVVSLPTVSVRNQGILDDILLRSVRAGAMQAQ